jgi:hypothetical protein
MNQLSEIKEIKGLFNITVSQIDDILFLSNSIVPEPGAINTFALYADENGKIKSAGIGLTYNTETEILSAPSIVGHNFISNNMHTDYLTAKETVQADKFVSEIVETNTVVSNNLHAEYLEVKDTIKADRLVSENIEAKTIIADSLILNNDPNQSKELYVNYLNFLKKDGKTRFAAIHADYFKRDTLAFITEKDDGTVGCAIIIDSDQRVTIDQGRLNTRPKTITSAYGVRGDRVGDLVIDENYIYYCRKNFDGSSKIWARAKLSEW